VGALPIVNRVLNRMRLEKQLQAYLPAEDGRTRVSTPKTLVVLVRNLLLSREPLYGIGEWAAQHAPDLLGLSAKQVACLNDDRMGRALDRLFVADASSLALAVAATAVREFKVSLDELHNDSTTVSFMGAYVNADGQRRYLGRPTLAITWGHNKDHRPDLKQLLFILTVTEDGGVPIHFRAADGNTGDDTTHRQTWDLLCQLAGRCDFLYVADSKMATRENMQYVDQHGGKFISVLPRSRAEDGAFRRQLLQGEVSWRHLLDRTDECGQLVERYSVCDQTAVTTEGYRLVWYHSMRKAERDAAFRSRMIQKALRQLAKLRQKLLSPKTRYRQEMKVRKAVDEILEEAGVTPWITYQVTRQVKITYRAEHPGRPSAYTRYIRQWKVRFDLTYDIDLEKVAEDSVSDGAFPLVTNVGGLSPGDLLAAYKRQPVIEKRFSQLKTDFAVAPVYLKEVRRIQAILCVYFFALMAEALVERELRQAMQRQGVTALPMYPEGRSCSRPTARRLIDLFATVQRHELTGPKACSQVTTTDLTRLQRRLLRLLGIPASCYGGG
jgi:transposase